MFWAFDVIARPHTHDNAPSFGAIHSTGTPSSTIVWTVPRPPSAITASPDLNRFTIEASESANARNVVAVVEQELLDLLDLLVAEVHRVVHAHRQGRLADRRQRRRLERHVARVGGVEQVVPRGHVVGVDLVGVDDQPLRPGRGGDEQDVAVLVADLGRVREGELVEVGHRLRVERPEQSAQRAAAASRRCRPRPRRPRSRRRASPPPPCSNRRSRPSGRGRGSPSGTGRASDRPPCPRRRRTSTTRSPGRRGPSGPEPRRCRPSFHHIPMPRAPLPSAPLPAPSIHLIRLIPVLLSLCLDLSEFVPITAWPPAPRR